MTQQEHTAVCWLCALPLDQLMRHPQHITVAHHAAAQRTHWIELDLHALGCAWALARVVSRLLCIVTSNPTRAQAHRRTGADAHRRTQAHTARTHARTHTYAHTSATQAPRCTSLFARTRKYSHALARTHTHL
mmetsp:Transcript_42774/g.96705  ORF Transcript_42774/g.96705 Transcript_42774/m.96705 type:complete len:133 (-) Transcript_42774:46-444(-)